MIRAPALSVLLIAWALPAAARAERRLTLAEAVELALGADPTLSQARIGGERSRLAVLRAQLDRVSVTVDGTMSELWNKTNLGGAPAVIATCALAGDSIGLSETLCRALGGTPGSAVATTEGFQGLTNLSARVSAPLFTGFRVSSNVALRQRQAEAWLATQRQARRDVALAVARAYWGVRRLELGRDVVRAAVDRMRESETVSDARLRAGLAPPIDRNRAILQRLQQEVTIAELDGQSREQAAQLGALLGVHEELVLVDEPLVPPEGPPAIEQLVAGAARGRPELARARLAYLAQEQVARIARADYFPQLSAVGQFQFGNNQFNIGSGARSFSTEANPFSQMTGSVTLGLQLNWNFFNMLTTYTNERDARYELARLGEEVRLVQRGVEIDVRVTRARLERLYGQRRPLLAALEVARDNRVILEGRYRNGDAMVIELLQAQIDLTTLERQLADNAAQIRLAWLELDAALGNTVGLPA